MIAHEGPNNLICNIPLQPAPETPSSVRTLVPFWKRGGNEIVNKREIKRLERLYKQAHGDKDKEIGVEIDGAVWTTQGSRM